MEHSTEIFKRFIIFEFGWYYPSGGIYDAIKSFDLESDAREYYDSQNIEDTDNSWAIHIFDCDLRKIIANKSSKS